MFSISLDISTNNFLGGYYFPTLPNSTKGIGICDPKSNTTVFKVKDLPICVTGATTLTYSINLSNSLINCIASNGVELFKSKLSILSISKLYAEARF